MNREQCLGKAKECVCGKREQEYGSPERNFSAIAAQEKQKREKKQ